MQGEKFRNFFSEAAVKTHILPTQMYPSTTFHTSGFQATAIPVRTSTSTGTHHQPRRLLLLGLDPPQQSYHTVALGVWFVLEFPDVTRSSQGKHNLKVPPDSCGKN